MRIWLVEVSERDGTKSYLPDWNYTRREAGEYAVRYRAEFTVDAPMRPVRFDQAPPKRSAAK